MYQINVNDLIDQSQKQPSTVKQPSTQSSKIFQNKQISVNTKYQQKEFEFLNSNYIPQQNNAKIHEIENNLHDFRFYCQQIFNESLYKNQDGNPLQTIEDDILKVMAVAEFTINLKETKSGKERFILCMEVLSGWLEWCLQNSVFYKDLPNKHIDALHLLLLKHLMQEIFDKTDKMLFRNVFMMIADQIKKKTLNGFMKCCYQ